MWAAAVTVAVAVTGGCEESRLWGIRCGQQVWVAGVTVAVTGGCEESRLWGQL